MTWLSDSGIGEKKAKCQVPQKFIVDPGSSGIKRAEGSTAPVLLDPLPDKQVFKIRSFFSSNSVNLRVLAYLENKQEGLLASLVTCFQKDILSDSFN